MEDSLREEYSQCWQDFRYRTTEEAAFLTIYFATTATFFYIISGTSPGNFIGFLIGAFGFVLSVIFAVLMLGERRPWSADIARMKELETILSSESPTSHLARITEYERLWKKGGYRIKIGSVFPYLIAALIFGAIVWLWIAMRYLLELVYG